MLISLALGLLAQEPTSDGLAYVRAHRAADVALVASKLDEAREQFTKCLSLSPSSAAAAYALACTEARASKRDEAFEWLDRAVELGYADAAVAEWDADLATIRGDERFRAALERMRKNAGARGEASSFAQIVDHRNKACVNDVAIDVTGHLVAVAEHQGFIRLLDARNGHELRRSPSFEAEPWAVTFDKSGTRLAALTWNGDLALWHLDGTQLPRMIKAIGEHGDSMGWPFGSFLRFDPTGERLLVAGRERGASLWTSSGELIKRWSESFGYFFDVTLAWSTDGTLIAAPKEKVVRFINAKSGEWVDPPLETPENICSVAFQPGGHLLATGHSDNRLRIWDLETRKLVLEHFFADMFDQQLDVNAIAFSPGGSLVAASTGEYSYLEVLDVPSGKSRHLFEWGGGHFSEPYEICWSRDARQLWFAFCCGGMPMEQVVIDKDVPKSITWHGRAPRISEAGIAVSTTLNGVLALDDASGRCLWYRPALGRDGELIQTSTGYFAGGIDDFDELEGADPMMFDPKRVRAANAAVALVTPKR